MPVFQYTHIGQHHINNNEDAVICYEISKERMLLAVMDGCSSGTDSHFASQLIAKSIRKIAKDISYQAFVTKKTVPLNTMLSQLAQSLFNTLAAFNRQLDLQYDELLSTVVIALYDHSNKTAEILVAGDGFIACNGKQHEYEQENKPDYMAYHLSKSFEEWYEGHTSKLTLTNVEDLSLSTDGVFTFRPYDTADYPMITDVEITNLLLNDVAGKDNPLMLQKKCYTIKSQFGLVHTDDLSIVRLIVE
jgi:serine/threonine protein phosphatase PrpC